MKWPMRYIPKSLTFRDKQKQIKMIKKSKRLYKEHKYFTRKRIGFKNKKSSHITDAQKIYDIETISPNKELVTKTGCSLHALEQIVKKGEGAYYSSGSRPNQTPQSWGIARLASSVTGGKASAVDYDILENGCKKNSKALTLAKKAKKKYGHGTRRAKKINI